MHRDDQLIMGENAFVVQCASEDLSLRTDFPQRKKRRRIYLLFFFFSPLVSIRKAKFFLIFPNLQGLLLSV